MSADYYAYAFLGIIVDASSMRQKVPAFKHNHPQDWKVDPVSGKQLWKMQSGKEALELMSFGNGCPSVEIMECGYETDTFAIGYNLCQCQGEEGDLNNQSSLSLAEIQDATPKLKARLRKAGLVFNDENFGIQVVIRVSV